MYAMTAMLQADVFRDAGARLASSVILEQLVEEYGAVAPS